MDKPTNRSTVITYLEAMDEVENNASSTNDIKTICEMVNLDLRERGSDWPVKHCCVMTDDRDILSVVVIINGEYDIFEIPLHELSTR